MNVDGKNAGYAFKDEIFKWQDELDDLEYSNEGLVQLYLLTEDILDTLESRLDLNPKFVKKMEEIHQKIEAGDTSDFVEVQLPKKSFFDYVNDYADAEKIGDVIQASTLLICYVKEHINDVDCYIEDNKLWIKPLDNKSLSTSIISELLGIKAINIDDSQQKDLAWCIPLGRR